MCIKVKHVNKRTGCLRCCLEGDLVLKCLFSVGWKMCLLPQHNYLSNQKTLFSQYDTIRANKKNATKQWQVKCQLAYWWAHDRGAAWKQVGQAQSQAWRYCWRWRPRRCVTSIPLFLPATPTGWQEQPGELNLHVLPNLPTWWGKKAKRWNHLPPSPITGCLAFELNSGSEWKHVIKQASLWKYLSFFLSSFCPPRRNQSV